MTSHLRESQAPQVRDRLAPWQLHQFLHVSMKSGAIGKIGVGSQDSRREILPMHGRVAGALGHRMSHQQRKALEEIMKCFMFWRNADEVWQSSLFDKSHRFSNTILSLQTFVFCATRHFAKCIHGKLMPIYFLHLGVMQNIRPQLGKDVKSRVQTPDSIPLESTLEFIIGKCRLHRQQFSPSYLGQVFDFSWSPL